MSHKILTVVGARPQFIKAASLSRALKNDNNLTEKIVHTGQHFDTDMSDVFFNELDIPTPIHDLDVNGGSYGQTIGHMLKKLHCVMQLEKPDIVLVYGDTNSTLAGAVAASSLSIPIAHIEAGLRSFNQAMPEEHNRVLADHVSQLLFCPTKLAVNNLAAEGRTEGVHNVGDVMYDSTLFAIEKAVGKSKIITQLGITAGKYALSTVHRAENTDTCENLENVLDWLKRKAQTLPVILPLHPRTQKAARSFGLDFDGLTICDPIGYLDMTHLLSNAVEIYTDSGGLQKEAYFHKRPCVTLRDETEWVETIESGWNRLWTVADYAPRINIDEYGNGKSANLILKYISTYLNDL